MVSRRWPNGVTCPRCGTKSVYFDSARNGWECKTRHPKRKFTLKTGTIFEDSPLGSGQVVAVRLDDCQREERHQQP